MKGKQTNTSDVRLKTDTTQERREVVASSTLNLDLSRLGHADVPHRCAPFRWLERPLPAVRLGDPQLVRDVGVRSGLRRRAHLAHIKLLCT